MEYTEYEYQKAKNKSSLFINILDIAIREIEQQIRETIKARWLKGISVDGGKIGEYHFLSYKKLKLQKNPLAGGNVDLTLTGALGDSISIIRANSGDFEIISTDAKYFKIGSKYGFEEFGLTKSEMTHFMGLLERIVNNKLKEI